VQPVLFLFVLGYGLSGLVSSVGGVDYKKFMFPGTLAMSVVTTSIFSAISIVWDREFGFLREMLVAPVSRGSIILGKTAGGATVATIQGAIMLVLAPLVGVSLTPTLIVEVLLTMLLMATALTSFGVFVASRMKKMEGFQMVMQFLLFPMIFLAGAMFPVRGLPWALAILNRLDPLTYAIDPVRRFVLDPLIDTARAGLPPGPAGAAQGQLLDQFQGGVTWTLGSWTYALATWQELALVAAFAVVFLSLAVAAFSRVD
jgi:ABC-2 type transport system permease protein